MAKRKVDYVVVDYDNVTEVGLKDLIKQLNKNGAQVESTIANNRKVKKDEQYVKRAQFVFTSGQSATVFIGDSGDIYQLVVNGKKTPLPNASNVSQFAKGLVNILQRGQEKFNASKLAKVKKATNTAISKPLTRSLKKRAEEASLFIQVLKNQQDQLSQTQQLLNSDLASLSSEEDRLIAVLDQEKKETKDLKLQLSALTESNNE
ncbi:TPA: hypothetical protein ACX6RX_003229 [Photobacterium damselae]